MPSNLYPDAIADLLRSASGEWIEIRRDRHARIYALISKYRRMPPRAYRSGRFEFKPHSLGYGSGETRLIARHVPVTFPIDPPRAALDDAPSSRA